MMKSFFMVPCVLYCVISSGVFAAPVTAPATNPVKGHTPTVTDIAISPSYPDVPPNTVLTATYTYNDVDTDVEDSSALQWLADGVAIPGATGTTYTTRTQDVGKSISLSVTPKSAEPADPNTGSTVTSSSIHVYPQTTANLQAGGATVRVVVPRVHDGVGDINGVIAYCTARGLEPIRASDFGWSMETIQLALAGRPGDNSPADLAIYTVQADFAGNVLSSIDHEYVGLGSATVKWYDISALSNPYRATSIPMIWGNPVAKLNKTVDVPNGLSLVPFVDTVYFSPGENADLSIKYNLVPYCKLP